MKKVFFLVIYLIIFLSRIVAKEEIVFENTYQPRIIYFYDTNCNLIAYLKYQDENNISVCSDENGYSIITTNIEKINDGLYVEFLRIWNGVNESSDSDSRKIYKYSISILQKEIVNIKSIQNIKPSFTAEDTRLGLPKINMNLFSTNKTTSVKDLPDETSQELFVLLKGKIFELQDIVYYDNNVWLKVLIKVFENNKIGYIPFSALASDWKISENNL